jgi:hypothetical protein
MASKVRPLFAYMKDDPDCARAVRILNLVGAGSVDAEGGARETATVARV